MKPWLWLLLGVVASAITWTYVHRILLPWEHNFNVTQGRLKAEMGDLYPRWVGTRELLMHGGNPYGPEVNHEIQTAFYGHPIEQSYDQPASQIVDEQRFVYPVYVVFLLAPVMHADFDELQHWAPVVFGLLIALATLLWLVVLRWHPPLLVTAGMLLLVVSSPQIAQGLRLRQIGLFVTFLIAVACWCVFRQRLLAGGALLALATIKPQMVMLCLLWFLIWSLGDWKKRWPLAAGFGVTLAILAGAGELLLPRWPWYFIEGLAAYRKYFPTTSLLRLVLGDWLGGPASVLALAALLFFAWSKRKVAADSPEFADVLSFFLVASTLILPILTPYNQALLLLPIIMLVRDWRLLPPIGRLALPAVLACPLLAYVFLLFHPPEINSLPRTPLLLLLTPFVAAWLLFVRRQPTA